MYITLPSVRMMLDVWCREMERGTWCPGLRRGQQLRAVPALVDSQEDDATHDEETARDLDAVQVFIQHDVGDHCGKCRLEGEDQVGDTRRQVAEADIVESKAGESGTCRQEEEDEPAPCGVPKPQQVRGVDSRPGQESPEEQIEQKQEARRETEGVQQGRPRVETSLRGRTAHQTVTCIPEARQHSRKDPRQVSLPCAGLESAGNQNAASKAGCDCHNLDPSEAFLQEPPAQKSREGRRGVAQNSRHSCPCLLYTSDAADEED